MLYSYILEGICSYCLGIRLLSPYVRRVVSCVAASHFYRRRQTKRRKGTRILMFSSLSFFEFFKLSHFIQLLLSDSADSLSEKTETKDTNLSTKIIYLFTKSSYYSLSSSSSSSSYSISLCSPGNGEESRISLRAFEKGEKRLLY